MENLNSPLRRRAMNETSSNTTALFYLARVLLKRRALRAWRALRRPTTLVGFLAVLVFFAVIFRFRHEAFYGQLVRRESLIGLALIMLGGSLFSGFLQRGLGFELPDLQFLFTSPFTQRQIVLYRLLPNYAFAVIQGLLVVAVFAPHLEHPCLATVCLILFQVACFHVSTAAAIFAGAISPGLHYRLRCLMLGFFFITSALYLRLAWDVPIVPRCAASPLAQLLFYPALTLPDLSAAPELHRWSLKLGFAHSAPIGEIGEPLFMAAGLAGAALVSFAFLMRLRASVFEAALTTTGRLAERRRRVRQGCILVPVGAVPRSFGLPRSGIFRGVGALVWKNLVVARRSKRDLLTAAVFVLIYAGSIGALVWKLHALSAKAGAPPARESLAFCAGVALFIGMLGFFLQRMFPYDFRRDGQHLVGFRTLPVTPSKLVLAELAVPCGFVLVCQAIGLLPLLVCGYLTWPMVLFLVLAYPTIALALNGVWNVHYLLAAVRRAAGHTDSPTAVGTLLVVALSFLVFWPAAWASLSIGRRFNDSTGIALAASIGLVIQILVDLLLVWLLVRLFQRFEVARDA